MDEIRDLLDIFTEIYVCVIDDSLENILYQNRECPYGNPIVLYKMAKTENSYIEYEGNKLQIQKSNIEWEGKSSQLFQISTINYNIFREESTMRLCDVEQQKAKCRDYINRLTYDIKNPVQTIVKDGKEAEKMVELNQNSETLVSQILQTTTKLIDRINGELDVTEFF